MNSLLSMLFSLAIGATALYYALPMLVDAQMQPAQNDAGNQIATLQAATVAYIQGNANSAPLNAITPGTPLVMVPTDFPAIYLPATFKDFNVFGQSHAVVITQNSSGQFEALVYTYNGDQMIDSVAIRVAQAGPPNSVVYLTSDLDYIEGAAGGEQIPIAQFQNATHPITAGHIGAHILPASLAAQSPFLNRYATGNLDDNTMHTAEFMDGNDLDMGASATATTGGGNINMAAGNVTAATQVSATQQVNTPMVADPTTPSYQISMAGTSNIQNLTATGTITSNVYLRSSDASLKTNVRQIAGALDLIRSMQGDRFQWIEDGSPSMGFIAQEVQRVFPEAVKQRADGKLAVEYDLIAAPLVEAVKELSDEVEQLKAENSRLADRQK